MWFVQVLMQVNNPMKKVFEGEIEDFWISHVATPKEMILDGCYFPPEHDGNRINFNFPIPISKMFDKFPEKPKKIIIFIE